MALSGGYLRDEVTQERIDFQFLPAELPVATKAEWNEHRPRGSSHARRHYVSTDGRKGEITLLFIRQTRDASDVESVRRKLEALPFPEYDARGQLRRGPHPQLLVFGAWRTLRVLIEEVKVEPGPFFLPESTQPAELRATLSWTEAPARGDLSRDDVLGGM